MPMVLDHEKDDSLLRVRKRLSNSGRSMVKPLIALLVVVVAAVGTALFLLHRNGRNSPSTSPAPFPNLNGKPVIISEGWAKGDLSAKTVLVEFGDFQCPSCSGARLKVSGVLAKYGKGLKVVFKQYPMDGIHRNAMLAALAAEAAGRQFKFWEMHDLLFSRQREWSDIPDVMTFFLKYAADLQMDVERFRMDMLDNDLRNKIFRDMLEGQVAQVRSVPTFFLNGSLLQSVKSDTEFEEIIAQAIKSAQ